MNAGFVKFIKRGIFTVIFLLVSVYALYVYSKYTTFSTQFAVGHFIEGGEGIPRQLSLFYIKNISDISEGIGPENQDLLIYIMSVIDELNYTSNTPKKERLRRGFKIAEYLLSKGSDINAKHKAMTALHVAILYDMPEFTEFLLAKGANPIIESSPTENYTGTEGMTPLEFALYLQKKNPQKDFSQVIKLLQNSEHQQRQ